MLKSQTSSLKLWALLIGVIAAVQVPAAEGDAKAARDDSAAEKLGWRVSMASYTLRAMTFMEEMDALVSLGIKYVDIHPSMALSKDNNAKTDHNLSADLQEVLKKKLKDAGIKAVSYGNVNIGNTEESARKVFAFAKAMGIENIVCEASPALMPMLDKLTEEYGVNIALHNHPGPKSTYWDPEIVVKTTEGRGKRIGACADTGHWQRSGFVPVEGLKKLKGRIISLHFKDVVPAGKAWTDTPWGAGQSDVKAMLAELKAQGFKGVFSIEYEHGTGKALLDDIAKCVKFFDKTAAELLAGK
ncbi:MAG: sugar phosphate isomerase/epimerase [Planctomycetota bacterium]|nr:sugar phosphate isomerase/epimerase [Planctomycetota bacterium]